MSLRVDFFNFSVEHLHSKNLEGFIMALKRLATETIITSKGGTGRVEPGQGAGIKAEEGMHIS